MTGRLIIFAAFLLVAPPAAAETTQKTDRVSDMQKSFYPREQAKDIERVKQLQDVTGQEWLELSLGERMDHMLATIYLLQSFGVEPRKSLNDYCNSTEHALVLNSGWYQNQLTDIVAHLIYESEPGSRAALEKFTASRGAGNPS